MEFVILATDGLWDVVEDQVIHYILFRFLRGWRVVFAFIVPQRARFLGCGGKV